VRLLFGLLFTFTTAAVLGLGATWLAATEAFAPGEFAMGAWKAAPTKGSATIEPFARAAIARSGALPLGQGDGIALIARHDDAGRPLDGRCDVVISGSMPAARYWTLTLHDPQGGLIANPVGRYGLTSREILWGPGGGVEITAADRARPGNWLPTGGAARYVLALRLYDTPMNLATRSGRATTMPSITAGTCS